MDPFLAEIRMFPFTISPTGWARCNGQLLPISQNTALFSLLGTAYGGDGKSVFALPDIQGSVPMHPGQGPGLSNHLLGEVGGAETVTLLESEIPSHTHAWQVAAGEIGDERSPADRSLARTTGVGGNLYGAATSLVLTAPESLAPAGGDQPHNNMQPYLTFFFNIALQGVFPRRP